MATYDPQRNRGRRPVHDDEPAAVDELLGIVDESATGEPPVVPAAPTPPEPEPVTVVPPSKSAPGSIAPRESVPPATSRRGAALPAMAAAIVAVMVAWLLWRLRRRS